LVFSKNPSKSDNPLLAWQNIPTVIAFEMGMQSLSFMNQRSECIPRGLPRGGFNLFPEREDFMANAFLDLIETFRRGKRSVFSLGPFLPIETLWRKGWHFNQILQEPEAMAQAALANLDLGFESIVLPFDLNVEAEALGARVRYHEDQEGIPVYPTIVEKIVSEPEDVVIPAEISSAGRIPRILSALGRAKARTGGRGAVGAFVPGPFTLAGQVMDMDKMFVMTMKRPEAVSQILCRLAQMIIGVRDAYVRAGAQFIVVEEGGATAISPRLFANLNMPHLQTILAVKEVPHLLFLTGNTDPFIRLMLQCGADGLGVDQACNLDAVRAQVPSGLPLAAVIGDYTMLAKAEPDQVRETVGHFLDKGLTLVLPPADIYPPAKGENIVAFVDAVRSYCSPSTGSKGSEAADDSQ
jgi:[methyl-Co(III) methanol-specific corrinoid protein]:coenzyme M methyltransferase